MSNRLTPKELADVKESLANLEHAPNLTAWETSFIESVTEQTDEAQPWLTTRQLEILHELHHEKGGA